jgi:hypothetical protein
MLNLIIASALVILPVNLPAEGAPKPVPAVAPRESLEMSHQARIEMEVELMMGDPAGQQIVLSAMLCDAEDRLRVANHGMDGALPSKVLVREASIAMGDMDDLQSALSFLGMDRLACTYYDVSILVDCLVPGEAGKVASKICSAPKIQAAVRLADRLAGRLASRGAPAPIGSMIPARMENPFVGDSWPYRE